MRWSCDFETTTDPNGCRVWLFGAVDIDTQTNFIIGNNIDEFILWCETLKTATLYFHNLKFDGEFIIYYLLHNNFKHVKDRTFAKNKSFTTLISSTGQFYNITIYFDVLNNEKITIYDSLKILPFRVKEISTAFNLAELKLDIDYDKPRPIDYRATKIEIKYLKHDVVIVAKALKILFDQNLTKITQGSNALFDYKNIIGKKNFLRWYPPPNYDGDIRQAYRGGWTYINPKYKNKDVSAGVVLDVNSLYPSVMYNKLLPFGEGKFFKGKYENDKLYCLHIQMLTCQFEVKENFLPTIQLKNNLSFIPTEYITSSENKDVTLCLTNIDLELFYKHYNVYNIEYHNGWKFKATTGLFKDYVEKWYKIKEQATIDKNDAMRTLSKLMLNALYGKFATNPTVQSKLPYLDKDDDIVKYKLGDKEQRTPVYIPMGVFITSWARYITITAAQQLQHRFIYADTDSLHLEGRDLPHDLDINNTKLGAWKHEATFTRARFIRAKSYIEEINNTLVVTCAGMPDTCHSQVTWDNFREGAVYTGKLQQSHVKGGIVLKGIEFSIRV